jgi:malate dehydrogenase (oxaloacetate-decarboxylating)
MYVAAAYAIAGIITDKQLNAGYVIPSVFNENIVPVVAKAVKEVAEKQGISRKNVSTEAIQESLIAS